MRAYRKLYPERAYALIDLYTNLLGAERYASNSQIVRFFNFRLILCTPRPAATLHLLTNASCFVYAVQSQAAESFSSGRQRNPRRDICQIGRTITCLKICGSPKLTMIDGRLRILRSRDVHFAEKAQPTIYAFEDTFLFALWPQYAVFYVIGRRDPSNRCPRWSY